MAPCYVGKGKPSRVQEHKTLGSKHYNLGLAEIFKRAAGPIPYKIVFQTEDEQEAYAEEIRLIAEIGRSDLGQGTLCNLTNGGGGISGFIAEPWTPDRKAAKSIAMLGTQNAKGSPGPRGYRWTDQHRANQRVTMLGNKNGKGRPPGFKDSPERIAAKRIEMKGNKRAAGYRWSPEALVKRSEVYRRNKEARLSEREGND